MCPIIGPVLHVNAVLQRNAWCNAGSFTCELCIIDKACIFCTCLCCCCGQVSLSICNNLTATTAPFLFRVGSLYKCVYNAELTCLNYGRLIVKLDSTSTDLIWKKIIQQHISIQQSYQASFESELELNCYRLEYNLSSSQEPLNNMNAECFSLTVVLMALPYSHRPWRLCSKPHILLVNGTMFSVCMFY